MEKASKVSLSSLPFPINPQQTHPWLLISQGENLESHTLYSVSKNEHLKHNIPEFQNKHISPTSFGWLALIDAEKSPLECCLMNSSSKEKIQLPPIEVEPKSKKGLCYECILSKPPNDPDCHVLLLSAYDDSLFFCKLGDKKFIERTARLGDDLFRAAIGYKGKIIVWMVDSCNFAEIDFVGEELIHKQLVNDMGQPCQIPWPSPSTSSRFADYLVESCGELLLVHMICYYFYEEVSHFRIFQVHESLELNNIGDRTIFLSPYGSMCITSSDKFGIKKNSIYYTANDRHLYVYDIENRSKTPIKLPSIKRDCISLMSWVMM